jgi:twitching motility two-component system response regulator PilH
MDRFNLASLFRRKPAQKKPTQKKHRQGERRINNRTVPNGSEKILVVDDSKTVRLTLTHMLKQGHYETLVAEDGGSGIKQAVNHRPQLIIMDIMMPGINGFRATRYLKKDERTKDIPVIMISGNKEAIDQFWMKKIGADEFLAKPFKRGDLFRVIESVLYHNEIAA